MREIIIDDVTHQITVDAFRSLYQTGAIIGNDVDGYFLNEFHNFTAAEVRLLMNA